MSNNIFYKALATINTIGIVMITGAFIIPRLDKGDTTIAPNLSRSKSLELDKGDTTIAPNLSRSKSLENDSAHLNLKGDLGIAEDHNQDTFNIWCGIKKNECKVTFEDDRLRVNDGEGIKRSQVVYTFHQRPVPMVTEFNHYTVVYKKIKNKKKGPFNFSSGTFIIKKVKDDHKFKKTFVRWTGKAIGLEASNTIKRGGGVSFGDGGAGIREANYQNQLILQQTQYQNKLNSLPPQYRGTVSPP